MQVPILSARKYFAVENFEAVYADVQSTWQDPEKAAQYHRFFGELLTPDVRFAPGAEDRMEQEVEDGALAAIAFTHGKALDPVQIAAMAYQQSAFAGLMGRTMIGAKVSLFEIPFVGSRIPDLGAIPIWVRKDVLKKKHSPEEREHLEAVRLKAGKGSIETEIVGMNSNHHMVKHVEGTRNTGTPLRILKVRDGYGQVVCGVDPGVNILMMTGAFDYGEGPNETWRSPTICLDILPDQTRTEPEQVTRLISPALQSTLDRAVSLHRR